jgi:hypothetical protein
MIRQLLNFILFLSCLLTQQAQGQSSNADVGNSEFALHMGRLLPAYIEGVDDIMAFWGFRHSIARSRNGYVEWGLMTARGYGTEWHQFNLSLRGDIPIEYMTGVFYVGADGHLYNRINETEMRGEGGVHVGVGLLNHLAENVWFRVDMKFNFSPGTQLYLGFSLVFKEPGAKPSL